MKKLMTICVFVGAVCVLTSVASADLQVVYQTDFSSDPGWITNNTGRYYWDPCDSTFVANQINVNGGGYYAYHDTDFEGGSFRLEWDIKMSEVDWASCIIFGLFDADLNTREHGYVEVWFGRDDGGRLVYLQYRDSEDTGQQALSAPTQYLLDTWYHVVLKYNAVTESLTANVTLRETGEELVLLSLSNVGAFASDMTRVGTSNVREGNFQVPGAEATGKIDNVIYYIDQTSPVAYWSFDDPCEPGHDDSGNGNDGTVYGAASVDGDCGRALDFDGVDDHVTITRNEFLEPTDFIAVSLWFKANRTSGIHEDLQRIINKSYGSVSHTVTAYIEDNKLYSWIRGSSGGEHPQYLFDDTSSWHHLCLSYDGSETKLYLDNVLVDSDAMSGPIMYDSHDWTIGGGIYYGGHYQEFNGFVDEVRIYDRALSASQIQELANECAPPENTAPVADAGENIQIVSSEQAGTVLCGSASDADEDALQYRWLEGEEVLLGWSDVDPNGRACLELGTLPYMAVGNHPLSLEVTDGQATVTDEMILTIDNSPPEAQPAPSSQVVEVGIDPIVVVADVSDFDGDTLTYEWRKDGIMLESGSVETVPGGGAVAIPDCNVPAGDERFGVGEHEIELKVDDGINEAVSEFVCVEVTDTTQPSLSPIPSVTILWPPNHKLHEVTIWANAFDNGGGSIHLEVEVQSSEPADGSGDGSTSGDYYIDSVDDETGVIGLRLRAERSGKGEGRIYTIIITATDECGNQSVAQVQITAPHDRRKK